MSAKKTKHLKCSNVNKAKKVSENLCQRKNNTGYLKKIELSKMMNGFNLSLYHATEGPQGTVHQGFP